MYLPRSNRRRRWCALTYRPGASVLRAGSGQRSHNPQSTIQQWQQRPGRSVDCWSVCRSADLTLPSVTRGYNVQSYRRTLLVSPVLSYRPPWPPAPPVRTYDSVSSIRFEDFRGVSSPRPSLLSAMVSAYHLLSPAPLLYSGSSERQSAQKTNGATASEDQRSSRRGRSRRRRHSV